MRNAWILVAIAAALAALACGTGPTDVPEPTATPTWQQGTADNRNNGGSPGDRRTDTACADEDAVH